MQQEITVPIVASVVLVLVGSIRAVASPGVRSGFAVFLGALALTAATVSAGIRLGRFVPNTLPSELAEYGREALNHADRNVLVIDGGSYPARGIDPKVLQAELSKRGYSTRVVLLSMSAGNHFERHEMYRDVLAGLSAADARNENWVLLAEVHVGYDERPFAQLGKNQDTARAYRYVTPANAAYGLYALLFGGGKDVELDHLPWVVARHALVNAFNVGAAAWLVRHDTIKPHSGYIRGNRDGNYRFPGLEPTINAITAPLDGVSVPPWSFSIRERRVRKLFAPFIKRFVYYGVPATTAVNTLYIRKFCELTREPCVAPVDKALLEQLNKSDMWFNAGHMSSTGARVFATWMAGRLDELGVLRK
jgi:hypothetical protein